MTMRFVACAIVGLVVFTAGVSPAAIMSNTDLWDVSQGSVVDSTSGVLNYYPGYSSDIRDMFGGTYADLSPGVTLFKDYMSPGGYGGSVQPGFTHYVEWHTPSTVTLRSFALHAHNEGMTRRAFSQFTLYSSSNAGDPWSTVYDTGPGYTYGPGFGTIETDVAPVSAQYFRAEFVQATWTDPRAVGPRVYEFDGFDTFLDGGTGAVPEPSTLAIWSILGLSAVGLVGFRRRRAA